MTKEGLNSLSLVRGEFGDEHYPVMTNFGYVDYWADLWPDKTAYVFRPSETEREAITYGDVKTATENLAVWMRRQLQVKKGDRVGILSLNRLAYVLCELALTRIGAVSVRIYVTMDTKSELIRNLGDTDCKVFFCQRESLQSVASIIPLSEHDPTGRLVCPELPKLEQVVCMTGEDWPGTLSLPQWGDIVISEEEREDLHLGQSGIQLTEDCSIYSTSGSTGVPKFVVHSHAGVLSFPPTILRRCAFSANDIYFADRPLAHLGGNAMSLMTVGATMVIANPWRTLAGNQTDYFLRIVKEENVTCGLSFPYLLYDLMKSDNGSEQFNEIGAKFFIFAGQVANKEVLQVVKNNIKAPLVNAYGTTEMGEVCCTMPTDSLDVLSTFCGKVTSTIEVKIVDTKTREILPRGEDGSIGIRYQHKWYYLNNEKKMKESHDEDGFFYPGDLARMAEDGYIQILGREDDQISVGTVKIYPAPIEMKICKHPAVDKAIVFGVPDDRLYEVIGAAVVPKSGETLTGDEIIKFFEDSVDEASLMTGSVMGPKFVWIEEAFPLTASGKVDKRRLRQKCLESVSGGSRSS